MKRKFRTRTVIVNGIDDIWSADLVEMQKSSKWNKGYRYLLNIIDVFSKFAWSIPIKNKTGNTITESFDDVIKKYKRKPKYLWVDQGSQFYNKTFKDWLKKSKKKEKKS